MKLARNNKRKRRAGGASVMLWWRKTDPIITCVLCSWVSGEIILLYMVAEFQLKKRQQQVSKVSTIYLNKQQTCQQTSSKLNQFWQIFCKNKSTKKLQSTDVCQGPFNICWVQTTYAWFDWHVLVLKIIKKSILEWDQRQRGSHRQGGSSLDCSSLPTRIKDEASGLNNNELT